MNDANTFISGDWRSRLMQALHEDGYETYAPVMEGEYTRFKP